MSSQISSEISTEMMVPKFFVPQHSSAGAWAWILQRLTGALLWIFLGMHLLATHFGWFTPNVYADKNTGYTGPASYNSVMDRMHSTMFWIDFTLLFIAVYHGLNGLKMISYDIWTGNTARKIVNWVLTILGLASVAFGTYLLYYLRV